MLKKFGENLFSRYTNCVIGSAFLVIFVTTTVSFFLTAFAIYRHWAVVDFDPSKGFETRGTILSQGRHTLEAIKNQQLSNEKILRWYYSQDHQKPSSKAIEKRSVTDAPPSTLEPITVNYDEYGVDSEPNAEDLNDHCEMFGAIGKGIPYEVVEYMAKVMIEVESYDQLFTVAVMKQLCHIDFIIDQMVKEHNFTNQADYFKNSLNLPLYTTCHNISTPNNCESINQDDISEFRKILEKCQMNSTLEVCEAFSINQVINWILPRGGNPTNEKLLITVVLKVTAFNGKDREFYEDLAAQLSYELEKEGHMKIVGTFFNMKDLVFQDNIYKDIGIAGASAVLVASCFLIYSGSPIFTVVILLVVALSAGVAFFIYTVVLGIDFFPFVNFLVIIILISIGADDALLLLVHFRKEIEINSNLKYDVGTIYIPIYHKKDLLVRSLRVSLHHSLVSMFVTSLTTAICFLTNIISPIIVLKCFGVYASLTVAVNYILVLLILPGALIITRPTSAYFQNFEFLKNIDLPRKLARMTQRFRYFIVAFTFISSGLSIWAVMLKEPGLTVPKHNPTKLLVNSNTHEFFDENVHRFNFEWKRAQRVVKTFLIGVKPLRQDTSFSPYQKEVAARNFSESNSISKYRLNLAKLQFYKKFMEQEVAKSSSYKYKTWVGAILETGEKCLYEEEITSQCLMEISAKTMNLIHQFPDFHGSIPGDGPFIDQNQNVIGYFMSIPTTEKLRIDVDVFDKTFGEIDESCEVLQKSTNDPVICMSSSEITRFYDVVDQLKSSNSTSVTISMITCLCVLLLITRKIKLSMVSAIVIMAIICWTITVLYLLGWHLSVVESTILIITIGLSFDYTLHYVVAINEENNRSFAVPAVEKMRATHSTAGIACLFGAITLVLAGCPLLFTQTSAFFQIGQMLVVLGITSLFGSTIVLPGFSFALIFEKSTTKSTKL